MTKEVGVLVIYCQALVQVRAQAPVPTDHQVEFGPWADTIFTRATTPPYNFKHEGGHW